MKDEHPIFSHEAAPEMVVIPPATETLLHLGAENSPWPERIIANPELQTICAERLQLSQSIDALYAKLPDAERSIDEGLAGGALTEADVAHYYNELTRLLASDDESGRLILYLPFELLPEQSHTPTTAELTEATARFLEAYKNAWSEQLLVHDLRADFMDGDVPEQAARRSSLPQVVKAAHLIPPLVTRGILSTDEVIDRLEISTDAMLAESIADALPVLFDLGAIQPAHIARMETSENPIVCNMAAILRSIDSRNADAVPELPPTDLRGITAKYHGALTAITDAAGVADEKITPARSAWLRQKNAAQALDANANEIARGLQAGTLDSHAFFEFVASADHDNDALIANAILHVLLQQNSEHSETAEVDSNSYLKSLHSLWMRRSKTNSDDIESVYLKLFSRGIIREETLNELSIPIPALDTPFAKRKESIHNELKEINDALEVVRSNSELMRMIYPVAITLGSRMKGYAQSTADLDVAIFVRPSIGEAERARLQSLIQSTFVNEKIGGHAMEFWLEEHDGDLRIKNFENPDTLRGDSSLPHPLLGAWCGDESAIKELYDRLMPGYLYSENKSIAGENARHVLLREMEHDSLQYRLMHKGYERFNARQGGIHTAHSDQIDGASMFYDSGYRRLANKLYVDRVFLPELDDPNRTT